MRLIKLDRFYKNSVLRKPCFERRVFEEKPGKSLIKGLTL